MKMKQYAKYKPSGVDWIGEIPEHWETKRLKYVASVQPSNVDKKTIEGELPVLLCNYMDVYKNEFIDSSINFMEATATEAEIAKFKIKKGDVLVTKDSETPDDIANPAFVKDDFNNIICAYHLTQIRPNRDELIGKYLFRLFQEHRYKGQFEVAANGVTRFGLSVFAFLDAFVPLPHPDEQTAIANYLDDKTSLIDTLVANKQKLIELLKEERTAIINHAVTKGINPKAKLKPSGIDWLSDIPEHWEVKKLKYVAAKVQTGSTPPSGSAEYYIEEVNWFTPSDFSDDLNLANSKRKISESAITDGVTRIFPANTVLIVGIGATLGKAGYISEPASSNQQINAICFNSPQKAKFYANYFYSNQQSIVSLANSATLAILNQSQTKDIAVTVPPIDEEIETIIQHIEFHTTRIDATISKIEKEIGLLQEYRTALISEVVTGKIKVI